MGDKSENWLLLRFIWVMIIDGTCTVNRIPLRTLKSPRHNQLIFFCSLVSQLNAFLHPGKFLSFTSLSHWRWIISLRNFYRWEGGVSKEQIPLRDAKVNWKWFYVSMREKVRHVWQRCFLAFLLLSCALILFRVRSGAKNNQSIWLNEVRSFFCVFLKKHRRWLLISWHFE